MVDFDGSNKFLSPVADIDEYPSMYAAQGKTIAGELAEQFKTYHPDVQLGYEVEATTSQTEVTPKPNMDMVAEMTLSPNTTLAS